MRPNLVAGIAMLSGMGPVRPCGPIRALRRMTRFRAVLRPPPVCRTLAAIAAVLCAACTASRGEVRVTPLAVSLRPLDTRLPIPLLVWTYSSLESLGHRRGLLLAAYDDGRIIFRTPQGDGYRTVTDTALVRRLYGSAGERAAYAALRDVRMPPEWQMLDGGPESLCLWTGGAMRCHHLNTPWGVYIGRPEACAGLAHDTTSYSGRRNWASCQHRKALHAALPTSFAAYYRRSYDAVQERARTAEPWPGHVFVMVAKSECLDGVRTQTPWPEGVPRPAAGERAGGIWGDARRLTMTVEQARRLRESDSASFNDCLVADGSAWGWQTYFELPNLGVMWDWEG